MGKNSKKLQKKAKNNARIYFKIKQLKEILKIEEELLEKIKKEDVESAKKDLNNMWLRWHKLVKSAYKKGFKSSVEITTEITK